jgi:hypothetical protein
MQLRTGNQFAKPGGHDPAANGGEIDAVIDPVHGATHFINLGTNILDKKHKT